jgi:hypothetical protein
MGVYDRDYWRERYNKLAAFKAQARFRLPASSDDDLADHAYFREGRPSNRKVSRPWHPVLKAVLVAWFCLVLYALFVWFR